jgi:imidazole glycerol phosphate synthase subunit HisF
MYVFSAGANRLVYSAFSASASCATPNRSVNANAITSNSIVATPSGAVGTVTYAWAVLSHNDPNSTPTLNNATSQTCTVTTNDPPTQQRTISVTVSCTVTDTGSGQVVVTNNVTINNTHTNGS